MVGARCSGRPLRRQAIVGPCEDEVQQQQASQQVDQACLPQGLGDQTGEIMRLVAFPVTVACLIAGFASEAGFRALFNGNRNKILPSLPHQFQHFIIQVIHADSIGCCKTNI